MKASQLDLPRTATPSVQRGDLGGPVCHIHATQSALPCVNTDFTTAVFTASTRSPATPHQSRRPPGPAFNSCRRRMTSPQF